MKTAISSILIAVALASAAGDALAQRFPGRERPGGHRDFEERQRERRAAPDPGPQDPFAALERELPSLKVDLMLAAGQVEAWSRFEREVRNLAEMDRGRKRYLLSLREPSGAPSAAALIASLAEEDQRRARASASLNAHFEALYGALDEGQRRMIDRRVVLSQTETLGRDIARPRREAGARD